ncbi:MAG: molybdenum cofactor guanylyltransferase MobA [Hyphomicrobiales bacterium]|nr:molybdenum cofactor guanylyltransferase MobA [Hyphomicrobiales bacterium]MCP4998203.1 molybdenum cofactor guanylyltransferase MobA [Hyphomicrobiales bacterium]
MKPEKDNIVGCVLAGGLSRRMGGGDKALRAVSGRPMLARVVERMAVQTDHIIINANGDPQRFSQFGLPVVEDNVEGFAGPLAGVEACMRWTVQNTDDCTHIATAAADTPFFPADLVASFLSAGNAGPDTIMMATSDGNRHPVFALWPVALQSDLEQWLRESETFKVMAWVRRHDFHMVDFPLISLAGHMVDPFFNANTPEDFAMVEKLVDQMRGQTLREGR